MVATWSREFSVRLRETNLIVVGCSSVVMFCCESQKEDGTHHQTTNTIQRNESVIEHFITGYGNTRPVIITCNFAVFAGYTANCEHFVVKIFSDSLACVKIKYAKIHTYIHIHIHNINDNVVQDLLSENYLMQKIIARNICNLQ